MLKKMIALALCVLISGIAFFPANAQTQSESPAVIITANGNEISETEADSHCYTYIVSNLSVLPVFSCDFDPTQYTANITQPCRENGYTATVLLTSKADGAATEYTINVYDENTFQSHFINLGGDPFVTYVNGWYYYMVTGNGFFISKSRELNRVNSNPVSVFSVSSLGFNAKEVWAPELHYIDGYWYIYFTAYDGDSAGLAKNHRMYALKSDTDDAQGSYSFVGQICEIESDYITDSAYSSDTFAAGHYAIDQSVFQWNGKLYSVWSGWKGYTNISQRIYIAEMSDPVTISGSRVELSMPEYAYETYTTAPAINEGPQPLISPDGATLNIAFSVNTFVDSHYALGMLTLTDGGDPLNPDDWSKSKDAVFLSSTENSTYSVGHCSFVPSPDYSEYYIIYHARRTADGDSSPREIRLQQFTWYDDGTPYFGQAISADTPVEIPSGSAIINRKSFEAESMSLSAASQVLTANSDTVISYDEDYYSGGSRIALKTGGASATFTFSAENSGLYTISLLASGNSAVSSGFSVTVNGSSYPLKICGNSNNINSFFWYDLNSVLFSAGVNTVTVSYTSDFTGGGYLDRIDISDESETEALWAKQNQDNSACKILPVTRKKEISHVSEANYGETVALNNLSDFDKYWFSSKPFIQEYDSTITSCGTGGNKRLLVSGERYANISDFSAMLSLSPSAAHTSSTGTAIKEESGASAVSSGILFRVTEMKDITENRCPFSGYRCFFIVGSNGKIKLQLHQYYFTADNQAYASSKMIAESGGLIYNPGDSYEMQLEVIGDTVNAIGYNKNSPETTISITNANLHISTVEAHYDCGRLGLFANPKSGIVTFESLSITPLKSPASAVSDLGNLNMLCGYDSYTTSSTCSHSADNGIISLPAGVSKLIVSDEKYTDIADFNASAKIKLTNPSAAIQTGLCFRVQDVLTSSPGLTGYAVFLQRTATSENNLMVVNLTKYGTKGSTTNVNIGNQSIRDYNLLSDISEKSDIVGLEFLINTWLTGNILRVTVSRADNPCLTTGEISWEIDNPDYAMNKTYPVAYQNGKIGVFSNGGAQISYLKINLPDEPAFDLCINDPLNGKVFLSKNSAVQGEISHITLCADSGYYIDTDALYAAFKNESANPVTVNKSWDSNAVYYITQPDFPLSLDCYFCKINPGDANADNEINIKDLVRAKKYLCGNPVKIFLSNTDIDSNQSLDSADLIAMRRILMDH